jgi:hypothetical protein
MHKDKEPIAVWPSFEEMLARIVNSRKPSSLAIAVNNPNIAENEYSKIHQLIGILSRNPLRTEKPPEVSTPTKNESDR